MAPQVFGPDHVVCNSSPAAGNRLLFFRLQLTLAALEFVFILRAGNKKSLTR
jgi:hypothetical protein